MCYQNNQLVNIILISNIIFITCSSISQGIERGLECIGKTSAESVNALLDLTYSQYPPKHVIGSSLNLNVNSALKKALANYHEDKQHPKVDG